MLTPTDTQRGVRRAADWRKIVRLPVLSGRLGPGVWVLRRQCKPRSVS